MAIHPERRWTATRRRFLYLTGLAATGLVAAACGGDELPGQTPRAQTPAAPAPAAQPTAAAQQPTAGAPQAGGPPTPAAASKAYREAPQLAQLVKDGKLPPVQERLPQDPLVLKPVEKAGQYGGTWRLGLVGGQDTAWLTRTLSYEHLVRWDVEWTQVIPNVAASFQASPDAKAYTFTLREGLKWSDGQPYSADDIVFYVEDIHKNKELTPSRGNNPPEVEKVDQYTVKISFATPNGLFLKDLATPSGDDWTRYPAHYLKQFHQKYNTTTLAQLVKQNNAEDWVKLFRLKGMGIPGTPYNAQWSNPELPTLHAWRIVEPYGGGPRVVAERNPFYFKVGTEGHQLPYVDRLVYDVYQDKEALVLKALNGEIDMQDRHIATLQNKAVFADNRQKGGYRFYEVTGSGNTSLALNLTHKDPVRRQIFQHQDFRIGLSHAINRQEVSDVVYVGQGEPYQIAPGPESVFYNEKLAKQYTEYDVAKANAHLDKVLPNKDGEGFRLGPDGKRLSFTIEVTSALDPTWADVVRMVEGYWRKVGVDAHVKVEDRSLLYTRKNANEHDAVVWGGGGDVGLGTILDPRWYFPFSDESNYAEAWASWFRNPSGAGALTAPEEPPPVVKQQMELYRQLQATGDEKKQVELMQRIIAIAADQFYVIGVTLVGGGGYGIVKNNFKNVPEKMIGSWQYPTPAPTNPPQYFFES